MKDETGEWPDCSFPEPQAANFLLCLIPTRVGTLTSFLIGEDVSKTKTIVYWNILSFLRHPGKVLPGYSHPSLLVVPATVRQFVPVSLG